VRKNGVKVRHKDVVIGWQAGILASETSTDSKPFVRQNHMQAVALTARMETGAVLDMLFLPLNHWLGTSATSTRHETLCCYCCYCCCSPSIGIVMVK
jgi:hypothetical protein